MKRADFVELLLKLGYLPEEVGKTGHVRFRHPETGAWFTLPPGDVAPALARGIGRAFGITPRGEITGRRGRTSHGARPGRPKKHRD